MLVNPNTADSKRLLAPIPGTRIVRETMGLLGTVVPDPQNPLRAWTIQGLYAPVLGRALGGLRAKLMDQKNFVTFINQRDLEVLLNLSSPGSYCPWLDSEYVGWDDEGWFGICCDEEDLLDDLFDRELALRAQIPTGSILPTGMDLERRIHFNLDNDMEELLQLVQDSNLEGVAPDPRFQTVSRRWTTIERTPYRLRNHLWHKL